MDQLNELIRTFQGPNDDESFMKDRTVWARLEQPETFAFLPKLDKTFEKLSRLFQRKMWAPGNEQVEYLRAIYAVTRKQYVSLLD